MIEISKIRPSVSDRIESLLGTCVVNCPYRDPSIIPSHNINTTVSLLDRKDVFKARSHNMRKYNPVDAGMAYDKNGTSGFGDNSKETFENPVAAVKKTFPSRCSVPDDIFAPLFIFSGIVCHDFRDV